MKSLFPLIILCFFGIQQATAQVTYAKPEEFKELKKRPLIVEQLEVDQDLVENWTKKKSKAKKSEDREKFENMISEYKGFVSDYNNHVKTAIERLWKLNENIEYKTTSQVEKLRKDKSERYTVLFFSESSSQKRDGYGFRYFPDLTIPTLNYSRIEEGTVRVDYSFFMPYTGYRSENAIQLADMLLSFKLMQNHIAEIEKLDKNRYFFKGYAEDKSDANCSKLKGSTIYVMAESLHKNATTSALSSAFSGKVESISTEDYLSAVENEEDKVVGIFIPHTIAAGSAGPMQAARILYMHVILNTKTGEIHSAKGTKMGEMNDAQWRDGEFKKMGC